jgi:argininosuccinate lyase
VRKGLPFRSAHEKTGEIVLRAINAGSELHEMPIEELRSASQVIDEDIFGALTLESTIESKSQSGGTSKGQVERALADAREYLSS